MRFKTDENIPLEAVDLLRAAGHDARSVFDESLAGRPDGKIASICREERRTLITLDTDFSDIRTYPPARLFLFPLFPCPRIILPYEEVAGPSPEA